MLHDELAAAAKRDPLEYRLHHLKDERGRGDLKRAAEMMNWQSRPSPRAGNANERISLGAPSSMCITSMSTTAWAWASKSPSNVPPQVKVNRVVCAYEGIDDHPNGVRSQSRATSCRR